MAEILPETVPLKLYQHYGTKLEKTEEDFNMRLCITYVDTGHKDGVCRRCGVKSSEHKGSPIADSVDGYTSTTTKPTNAYGDLKFPGYSTKLAKYIRLDHQTDPDDIVDLMLNHWKIKPPNLLISVTGGAKDFTMTPKLKTVFRSGLTKVALSTDAWIITGGTHSGVMKHVGEAVRDYTLGSGSYSRKQIVNIGITPWGVVHQRKDLIVARNPKHRRSNVASYHVRCSTQQGEVSLDPNHTHFILVDDGRVHDYSTATELRGKIEKAISEYNKKPDKGEIRVPVVCLVLEGGPGTLGEVASATKNGTPTVIIEGSGRAADLLAWAIRNAPEPYREDSKDEKLISFERDLQRKVEETLKSSSQDIIKLVRQCIAERKLFNIYELKCKGSSKEIDSAILNTVVKAKTAEKEQLRLSLAFSKIEIAERVLSKCKDKLQDLNLPGLLHTALINNQVQFVKLFLENGVSLDEFLTVDELTSLYKQPKPTSSVYRLLNKVKRHETQDRKMSEIQYEIRDIENLIDQMTDGTYKIRTTRDRRRRNGEESGVIETQRKEANNGTGREYFDNPWRELFLWSVFLNQHDMAKFFLEEIGDTMAASLVAMQCLRYIASTEDDIDSRDGMMQSAKDYEQLAIEILTRCYNASEKQTLALLSRKLTHWGDSSCVDLAFSARSMNFIAHTAVQELLSNVWYGKIDPQRTSMFRISCCTLCPPLLLCLMHYREPDSGDYEVKCQETNDAAPDTVAEGATGVDKNTNATAYDTTQRGRNDGDENLTRVKKLKYFFGSPVVKFYYSTFSYIAFLLLFSYVLLVKYDELYSVAEVVLVVWVTSLLFDEIRQIAQQKTNGISKKFLSWITWSVWNIVDSISMAAFYIGLVTRYFVRHDIGRYIWAIDLWVFYFRLLDVFSINRHIGPKVLMIKKMLVDLSVFIGILFVIMVGYGVAVQAVLNPGGSPSSLFTGIFYRPYFQIYGELFLDDISDDESCTGNLTLTDGELQTCSRDRWFVLVLLALYMMLSNVLLLNLLIAMFSYTFAAVQDNTDIFWKYQRYGLIVEYKGRPALCPPLIILSHAWLLIHGVCMKLRGSKHICTSVPLRLNLTNEEQKNIGLFELINTERYMESKESEKADNENKNLDVAFERLDHVSQQIEGLENQLERVISIVEDIRVKK
ncbi:transient receptor potential cation channel subfamily M member 2-like [Ptychodera flava]|uniref:transient receptor potential cation channel subfamily M member 2-like n=1 Tax=Ptychodera flava TaxID=63121 RepID=UPI003969D756